MEPEPGGGKERPRASWYSDPLRLTATAAVLSSIVALIATLVTPFVTLHLQDSAFHQQRALADRAELRKVIDQAASILDTTMTDLDDARERWTECRPKVPCSNNNRSTAYFPNLIAALNGLQANFPALSRVRLRLDLRLDSNSAISLNLKAAALRIRQASIYMGTFPPNGKHQSDLNAIREWALTDQDRFTEAARHLLNP